MQTHIEDLAERWSNEFNRSDIRNLAILVIDIPSNQVVAYCGNVHFDRKQGGNQVDVIQAPRSTGSILKPFLYYAMLQEGSMLPDMLLPDVPVNINGYTPQNFSMQYEGAEATLWDVTNAYAQMGRSLVTGHSDSKTPVSSKEAEARMIVEEDTKNRAVQHKSIWDKGAVWQTFNALKEVNRPEEIDWKAIPSMQPVAWKTGTSYGFRDAWAVGVTPRYAVGVWVGNATGEGKPGFNYLPSSSWFERPTGVFIDAEVCHQSGHLKGRFCEDIDTLLVLPAGLRTEACPYHHLVTLSADESRRIYENCANTEPTIQKSWFVLPPVWEWYYKQHHPEYKSLPPFKPGCGEDTFQAMQFIYPPMNARIKLPRQMDGSKGFITVELAHSNPDATIFWHLDETYQTQTQDFHKISLQPAPGKHSLTAVDDEGNTVSTTFFVE